MCHILHISTTSTEDLSKLPSDLFSFIRPKEDEDVEVRSLLRHPNQWFLTGKYGGCSCHFRHLWQPEEGVPWFSPEEDWFPEDKEDIESTEAAYDVFERIVSDGFELEILDSWNDEDLDRIKCLTVSMASVPREAFRFFESYRFEVLK